MFNLIKFFGIHFPLLTLLFLHITFFFSLLLFPTITKVVFVDLELSKIPFKSQCPVCFEDLHTSRKTVVVLKCGHFLHEECLDQLVAFTLFRCPICNTYLGAEEDESKKSDTEKEETHEGAQ